MGIFTSRDTANRKLYQFCRELEWSIDHENGPVLGFDFKGDRVTPKRTILAYCEDGKTTLQFRCLCRAAFESDNLPPSLAITLLGHNLEVPLGGWAASIEDTVSFSLSYSTFIDGMDAAQFSAICQVMVAEVAKIEAYLHRKGWL